MDWEETSLFGADSDSESISNNGSSNSSGDKQLLRLSISQALSWQYTMERTRGLTVSGGQNELSLLRERALRESARRHLTAGFLSGFSTNNELGREVVARRLGRELAAMGLSVYVSSLSNKRSIILKRMLTEYEREWRSKALSLSTKHENDDAHPALKLAISSSTFFMR